MLRTLLLITICLLCCVSNDASSTDFLEVTLPDGNIIKAEIAMDKAQGLQNRDYLCPKCGMIFIFDTEGIYSFWMKDTLLDLSLIWINKKREVVHIERNAKPCKYKTDPRKECQVYMPNINAKYVLEILPGASDSINIGSVLKFIPPG